MELPCRLLRVLWASAALSTAAASVAARDHEVGSVQVEVTRVVDGDTLVVLLDGEEEVVRLAHVDTEEKIAGRPTRSTSKPETVFGEETALWARELFASLAEPGEHARVELRFPGDRLRRDAYGRLLGHAVLPDGRDFNLLLVEGGWSPYFDKYGSCPLAHDSLARAQATARRGRLGIWRPGTNRARARDAPEAVRPYDDLLPWWRRRAEAIEEFQRRLRQGRLRQEDGALVAATDEAGLLRACDRGELEADRTVEVFGEVAEAVEAKDGALVVTLRGARPNRPLTARVPPRHRSESGDAALLHAATEGHQNFVYVRARVVSEPTGIRLEPTGPDAWTVASPRVEPREAG